MKMKLFALDGACSMAPHIILEHLELDYELVMVDRNKLLEPEHMAVNPMGQVPSLVTDEGRITESTAILLPTGDPAQPSFADQVATARQNPPDQQRGRPVVEAKDSTQECVRPVLISQNPSAVPANELYPTLQEVRASGSINLPDLHLDIPVFSPVPDDRFVFINMSKLREGSTLAEGPVVAEKTPEGVVLRHEGHLFLLPRE